MNPPYATFSALDPFFEVVRRGLSGLVDGEHFFDTIAGNAIFEFRYDIAGWPKRVEGRDALMALYRGGESPPQDCSSTAGHRAMAFRARGFLSLERDNQILVDRACMAASESM